MTRGGISLNPKGYTGSRLTAFKAKVLNDHGTTCHICGKEGADTVDHLIPRSIRPDLAYDLENARPAHRKCNSSRGNKPLIEDLEASGW